jgi:hypothetical protein
MILNDLAHIQQTMQRQVQKASKMLKNHKQQCWADNAKCVWSSLALAQTHGHSEGTTYFRVCICAANVHIFYTLNKRIDVFVELCLVSPFLHHQTNLICISAILWWTADMVANCYNKHNNFFKENFMCHKCYSITCYDWQKSQSTMYYVDAWIVHNLMWRKYNNGRVV